MLPKFRLNVDKELLARLKALPSKAKQELTTRVRTELADEIQQDVNDLMADGPLPVDSPFGFVNNNSRLFYIILVRELQGEGEHWLRSGNLETGWRVDVTGNIQQGLLKVSNAGLPDALGRRYGQYVFGPRLVPGHGNTGWPAQLSIARELVQEKMIERLREYWQQAVSNAVKGG